jgi:coenzyme F420-0:L-glutamate ligase/coenzyme F420-1:gamma-L-glutamate ligase
MILYPLAGMGEVTPGTDLGAVLAGLLRSSGLVPGPQDVLVIAQKVVSKAEDRYVELAAIEPSPRARELAEVTAKDPRLVEVILSESTDVLRARPGVLIVRHRLGLVMAQAGVDQSNVDGTGRVLRLPIDPDASADRMRASLRREFGSAPGVVISDSFGRPWRMGSTNVAIGASGVPALWDRRGERDRQGRVLAVTQVGWADAVAAAAGLLMGEGAEGIPAVLVRGLAWTAPERPARDLIRPLDEDLFR